MCLGPAQAILARGLQWNVGFLTDIVQGSNWVSDAYKIPHISEIRGLALTCHVSFVFLSVKSVNDGTCACASPSCTYARGFDLDSEAWAADPGWRSASFFLNCYPINILSKSPLLKYSIFQIFSAFSQKRALAFHFRRWSENKQFLGPLNQEVHRIYLLTDSIFWSDLSWNSPIVCEFRRLQPFYNISAAV